MLPTAAGSREAPTTAAVRGGRRGTRELAAAIRSRSSTRSGAKPARSTGNCTWMLLPSYAWHTSKPESRRTLMHGLVLGEHLGLEADEPVARGDTGEPFQHQRADAAPLELVVDEKGDLGLPENARGT